MAKKKADKEEEFSDKEEEDTDIYTEEGAEEELEEDEISPKEAGFMEGYEEAELAECGSCGKEVDMEKAIEKKIGNKTFWFCSKKCADNFEKRKAYD